MTSLSQTYLPAIVALLAERDPNHMVDFDVLDNLTGDSTDSRVEDYHTYITKRRAFQISIDLSLTRS